MPEMHLKQLGFTYSTCEPLTKNNEIIKKFREAGDSRYIYQNELDEACFEHDMIDVNFKDLPRRTASRKVLHDIGFKVSEYLL